MTDPLVSIKNVSIAYGKTRVVNDVSLDIGYGEGFGLVGLNGVGKTTLIKAMIGLRDPEEGDILIAGHSCEDKESKKSFSYLPERFDPPWFLSGLEFIRFSLSLYQKSIDIDGIKDCAKTLALDPEALNRRVHSYSKGMRQKLGLMATMLTECPLLILDEPMSGLDPKARHLVKDLIIQAKEKGQTVFICSHILADMPEICDRIAVFHQGKICFCDSPSKLMSADNDNNLEKAFLNLISSPQQTSV